MGEGDVDIRITRIQYLTDTAQALLQDGLLSELLSGAVVGEPVPVLGFIGTAVKTIGLGQPA